MVYTDALSAIKSIDYDNRNEEKQVKEDLRAVLKESKIINKKVRDNKLREKFQEEHRELEQTILDAINDDRKISFDERMNIILEL
jgi:hypothetical protein